MDAKDFWIRLEYRVCGEIAGLRDKSLRGLWCDGFSPDQFGFLDGRPLITGTVYMMDGPKYPGKGSWRFTLYLPKGTKQEADIDWAGLVPPDDATGWLSLDAQYRKMKVDPTGAYPDSVAIAYHIAAAFADTPYPGDAFEAISATQQDEGIVEYFRGTTWRSHTAANLRIHCAALSFFTGPAFRYWLPAFMLAELEDTETADVIADSIASNMKSPQRLALFSDVELRAVAAFLRECVHRYGKDLYGSAAARVNAMAGKT